MCKWESAGTFVELALSIDKHLPGYVDAYYGPEEIREDVDAKGKVPLGELSTTLDQITTSTRKNNKRAKGISNCRVKCNRYNLENPDGRRDRHP